MKRILYLSLLLISFSSKGQYTYIVAGHGGSGGYIGDGGPATAAALRYPYDVALSKTGNLYIADYANHAIRKVNPAGIITTVVGNHSAGYTGDGGPATAASITFPWSVAVDSFENLYIADDNNVIRKVNSGGLISTIAGGGTSLTDGIPATNAALYNPVSVAVDRYGNVYIADGGHSLIRKVNTAGIITTYAGNGVAGFSGDGGPATAAAIRDPRALRFDGHQNLYFADYANMRVRKIDSSGIITTVAGNGYYAGPGIGGYSGDGGPATNAALNGPGGVGLDKLGNIYISDMMNNMVRRVDSTGTIITALGMYSVDGPDGLAVDTANDLYFANTSEYTVRKFPVHCTPTAITARDSICTGSSIVVSNSILGGVWFVKNSHATITSWGRVTGVSAGTDTIVYATSNACGIDTVTRRITIVSPVFAGPVTGTDSVCPGATITLTDAVPGGIWSVSNPHASVSGGIVTGITAGLDTIRYTLTTPCGTSFSSKTIRVLALPSAGSITGPAALCRGAHISLAATVGAGLWQSSNANATVAGGYITGVSAGLDTIMYLVSNFCGTDTALHPVAINVTDSGIIYGPGIVCVHDSIVLSESVPGGTWTRINSSADITAAGIVTGITPGIDTIRYTVSDSCGTSSALKIVTINPLPSAGTVTGTDSLCIGDTVTLTNSATGGTWFSMDATIATISATGLVTGVATGINNIWYIVTNGCGSDTASFPISIGYCIAGVKNPTLFGASYISIYPNPNKGSFAVKVATRDNEDVQLVITNVLGEKVAEYSLLTNKETEVRIRVPAGIYFVNAFTHHLNVTKKVVIE